MREVEQYNYEEIYEILNTFIDYTKECRFTMPDLLYYLKFNLGVDCLEDFNNIESECLVNNDLSNNSDSITEEQYYHLVFSEPSKEDLLVLNKLNKVMRKYFKTGNIPDPYIECENRNKKKLK
jgi:hypothetical protein